MAKTFRPYLPHQSFLLPPSPMDWLPEGHLARFILEMVGELDLSGIMARYEREMRGHPPYHPQMMVALLLYAYCVGVPSSRKIERRTYEDIAFRVIAGNTMPVRLGSKTWCKCLKLATNPDLLKAPTNRSSGPWPTRHLPHPGARWPAS